MQKNHNRPQLLMTPQESTNAHSVSMGGGALDGTPSTLGGKQMLGKDESTCKHAVVSHT